MLKLKYRFKHEREISEDKSEKIFSSPSFPIKFLEISIKKDYREESFEIDYSKANLFILAEIQVKWWKRS